MAKLHHEIRTLLNSSAVQSIDFKLGFLHVNGAKFKKVITAIGNSEITLTLAPDLADDEATYHYGKNVMFCGFTQISGRMDRAALLVHECLHAACDIDMDTIFVKESEAAAYIAQCLYLANAYPGFYDAKNPPPFTMKILKEAWKVAMLKKSTYETDDLKELYKALGGHNFYKTKVEKVQPTDGV